MASPNQFPRLFTPGMIGKMEVKNRIVYPAFEKCYANIDGSVTQQYVDYIEERAKGGAGLLYTESSFVHHYGRARHWQLGMHDDAMIPGLKKLADASHKYGMKIAMHMHYSGRENNSSTSGVQPVGPSDVPCNIVGGQKVREISLSEIKDLVDAYAQAALRTKQAGHDMVCIHGAHGYIVGAFLSPYTNKRTDKYGGSFENRMRFPLEILDACRQLVGPHFPIAYRLSGSEKLEGGLTLDDLKVFAKKLEDGGIDLLDVSAGIYDTAWWMLQPMDFPAGCIVDLAAGIKSAVKKVPVMTVGRIFQPSLAEKILEEGKADFIGMGRPLHADPYLPKKAQEGRLDEIVHCVACNQACTDKILFSIPVSCMVNPAAGRERELAVKPAKQKKEVMVIGGGPAGMTAARIAAERGHKVTLYEKTANLGGQMRLAAEPPYKGMYHWLTRDAKAQMAKAGVEVVLNTEVTADMVYQKKPDAVVVAAGAYSVKLGLVGADKKHVVTEVDVLEGRARVGNKVVVYRGKRNGCQVAEHLTKEGKEVIVVETSGQLMSDSGFSISIPYMERAEKNPKLQLKANTSVEEIKDNSVITQSDGNREEIAGVDTFVFAWAMNADNALSDQLQADEKVEELYIIGDNRLPRDAVEAVREGWEVGLRI